MAPAMLPVATLSGIGRSCIYSALFLFGVPMAEQTPPADNTSTQYPHDEDGAPDGPVAF